MYSPEIQNETKCFVILGHFLSFYYPLPPNDLENKNFEKKKMNRIPGDIILLYIHVYHKWRSWYIIPTI